MTVNPSIDPARMLEEHLAQASPDLLRVAAIPSVRSTAKSLDLLAAGYLEVRLREHPLPTLAIASNRHLELTVHGAAPDPENVMTQVHGGASCPDRLRPEPDLRGQLESQLGLRRRDWSHGGTPRIRPVRTG